MSLPPLDLATTDRTCSRILLDELHALGDRRRDWLADLPSAVHRAEAHGLPTSTIAAAMGLTNRVLRRDLSAESRRGA